MYGGGGGIRTHGRFRRRLFSRQQQSTGLCHPSIFCSPALGQKSHWSLLQSSLTKKTLVPKAGLEPARAFPHASQTCVSTIPPLRRLLPRFQVALCRVITASFAPFLGLLRMAMSTDLIKYFESGAAAKDSNLGVPYRETGFTDQRNRPLCHGCVLILSLI